jgi:hypothetical protein
MPELSPTAQAVWDAYEIVDCDPYEIDPRKAGLSAALQAAADQVVPEEPLHGGDQRWMFERDARQACRKKLLAIAAELKAQ